MISVPSRVPELLGYAPINGCGCRSRTDGALAYETRRSAGSTRVKKWWRLAVSRRAFVVFSHAPSLDRPNLQNWQALRGSHSPGRFWRPTRPLGHLGPVVPEAGSAPAPSAWKTVMHLSTPLGRNWWSWTVTLRLLRVAGAVCCFYHYNPENGHDGGTCTREPRLCRPVPWLLGYVVLNHGSGRSDAGRLLPFPPSMTMGESGGAGGTCTRTVRIKSPLCCFDTTAPWCACRELHPDRRTGMPRCCSYTTRAKLRPCRTWAAGWLPRDPMGRSVLRFRIENRRCSKTKDYGIAIAEDGHAAGMGRQARAQRVKMAASTEVAPASLGLKDRDPRLVRRQGGVPHRRYAESRSGGGAESAGLDAAGRRSAPRQWRRRERISQKRTHTVVPLGRPCLTDWTAAGFGADVG